MILRGEMGNCFQSADLSLQYTDAFIGITSVLFSEELKLHTRCSPQSLSVFSYTLKPYKNIQNK